MNSLALALIVGLQGHAQDVRIEGPGYFRLIQDGRVHYAKSGRLQVVNGRLGMYNCSLMPTITINGPTASVTISETGEVACAGSHAGTLSVAVFERSIGESGLLTSATRPKIVASGSPESGFIRMSGSQTTKASEPSKGAAQPIVASKGLELRLRPSIEVIGEEIMVADVAELAGDPSFVQGVGAISLGPAPAIGKTKSVERTLIVSRLRAKGFALENMLLLGTGPVSVTRAGATILHSKFLEVARSAAEAHLGAGWQLTPTDPETDFAAPQGASNLQATRVTQRNGQVAVLVEILVDGKRINSRTVNFNGVAPTLAITAGAKVRVRFVKGDLVVEAEGTVKKAAALGAQVEVMVRLEGNKDQETLHTGTLVSGSVVEVKL